ncbi:hypothetical protein VTH82DRAFT_67 [Thermothelomyces myriococcoides]
MEAGRSLLIPIGLTLFLLAVDAAVCVGMVSSMISFLHHNGRGPFMVDLPEGRSFWLAGEPVNLVTDPAHTTLAAGGTTLILVGLGGSIALWLERRARKKWDQYSSAFYIWSLIALLSWLFTTGALIYTFVETEKTGGQTINLFIARMIPPLARYPGRWTPENWYAAVLDLPLAFEGQRRIIEGNLTIMRSWRWNLVAQFVLGSVLLTLLALEHLRIRRSALLAPFDRVMSSEKP